MSSSFISMFELLFVFLLILGATIFLSFLPERLLKPKAPVITLRSFVLQSLLVSLAFLILSLIVQRPIFSGLAILVFLVILVGVSNAKTKALKEPMVFSDFSMFSQAFKHPRLYFPFLGLIPVIIAPLLIIGLIVTVLRLEPMMAVTWQRILATLLAITLCYLLSKSLALGLQLSKQPDKDNHQYGLQNSLYAYFLQSRTKQHKEEIDEVLKSSPFNIINNSKNNKKRSPPPFLPLLCNSKPNITVIQSESFFDARRLHPSIRSDILQNFDRINKESLQFGKLKVPAWGANTMRTEFSFLTGLKFNQMGFYRYYPYQFLSKYSINSVASMLSSQGYHCICIHPHPASFFGRHKIFPKMGFDEFIDIESFNDKSTFGPYISDQVVTNKIIEVTQEKTDKPLFVFVITMENHGPLHLEQTTKEELNDYYSFLDSINDENTSNNVSDNENAENKEKLPKDLNDLTVYLRHLKNADIMIKSLTEYYRQQHLEKSIETRLCFYGDHIPSMPKIYQETNYNDNTSDYFIWHSQFNDNKKHPTQKNNNKTLSVEGLSIELFR